jgi:hypothetical protein
MARTVLTDYFGNGKPLSVWRNLFFFFLVLYVQMATSKEVFCGGVKDQQNIHVNTKMCQLVLSYCSLFRTKHFFPNQIHLQETYK